MITVYAALPSYAYTSLGAAPDDEFRALPSVYTLTWRGLGNAIRRAQILSAAYIRLQDNFGAMIKVVFGGEL